MIGVSGGVDSMVLLHVLRSDAKLHIAHFNHQLRGKASDADEQFVRRAARKLALPCDVDTADVKAIARKQKLSIEMAARQCRHEFYAQLARNLGIRTIALAHHADDQIELFFVRLFRGASLEGLAAMRETSPSPADPALTIVRPLLHATKEEIIAYATEHKIAFREDATNASMSIVRNKVRHKLIPLLKRQYQPALTRTILRTIELLRADSDMILRESKRVGEPFEKLPAAVQRRHLRRQLYAAGINASFDLIEHLLLNRDATINVSPELLLSRDAAGMLNLSKPSHWSPDSLSADVSTPGSINFGGISVRWSSGRAKPKPNTEHFDAERVGPVVTFRHWRPADRFQPIGMKKTVKLQDMFTNLKIPRNQRHERVVATTETGDIFWVEGIRIAERYKIEPSTTQTLQWRWRRHGTC